MRPSCPICASDIACPSGDLAQCCHCQHIFQRSNNITVQYDARYLRTYDRYPTDNMSHLRLGFLKAFCTSGRLLDIGYGNGAFAHLATKAGFSVFGAEVHGQSFGVNEINLEDDSSHWDVICFFDSLEHISDLGSLRCHLERSRSVMVSLPLYPPSFPADRQWKHYKPGEHLHYFSKRSLSLYIGKRLIAESNVEDVVRGPLGAFQNIYTAFFSN